MRIEYRPKKRKEQGTISMPEIHAITLIAMARWIR